ncbi:DNA-binding protein [Bacillus cereus]|uniref:DNA-binding protein n=1 Tax=Bacillus nitratireducens TaxID=2026193 RepID=UPI000BED4C23|nr:DNA-binding protein [Bacillus cereus]PEQ42827.1 DNA-binding protein [Bacillus cereus]PER33910.1 DNA-binding protein [Bacillus cereus]PEW96203.1 DNA-binding protein [Bacillus cereus]PEX97541.1 DNA-binding protein [Bacillus cereus]
MQSIFLGILSIIFLGLTILGLYTTFSKKVHDDYFDTLLDDTSDYILFFGLIGKGLLWICKNLFPKKYYIRIFRGITLMFSCLFLFLAAGIWFIDLNRLF